MSNAADRLMRWIIDASAGEPADHRVQILRDAAKIIAGGNASIELIAIANEIEATDSRIKQLLLGFENGNGHSEPAPETPTNGGPQGPSPAEDVP